MIKIRHIAYIAEVRQIKNDIKKADTNYGRGSNNSNFIVNSHVVLL